ncbi:MAG: hypothetical protein LQ338_001549 [Usnochroma carphineum]|nr:MAG: hypothetical protein LQ338_001549 [Usnochroma carphineum]
MSTQLSTQTGKSAATVGPKAAPAKGSPPKAATKMHRRSRSGCFTCRLRRKKCDEGKNQCKACKHLGLKCEYKRPMWWSNNEQRKQQKETIKNIIKRTKLSEKNAQIGTASAETPPGLSHSLPTSATYSEATARTRAPSIESQHSPGYDLNQPLSHDYYDFHPHVASPPYDINSHYQPFPHAPYEVDIKTERQMYVNDIPTRRDSMISTFSTYQPPSAHPTLPSFPEDEWINQDIYNTGDMFSGEEGLEFDFFDFSHGAPQASQQALIQVDDCDRPLLDHFIDNVLRLIFPVLEVNQHGSARSEVILPALESNKCYLHCCLSVSAIHLKSTRGLQGEQIDNDIVRHRFSTIAELCEALKHDTDHLQILEATLGMIFFQCSVGRPDDTLPDISWHQHFQAAISLVRKLELPHAMVHDNNARLHPPFNMTLTSWIDILGATMLGRSPEFADTYREKNQSGSTSGLCELMGCEDSMMYLISEIACLDALKLSNGINGMQLCQLIGSLGTSLDTTEVPPESLTWPYSSTGAIRPKQLSRNMTAVFRLAARIYLCSLVPDKAKDDPSMQNLVDRFTVCLHLIPHGPDGFDRSIVWPLLIAGSQSVADSTFRQALAGRIASLGEHAEFGSFGRMVRLLQEVWRQSDEAIRAGNGQNVHWRDVMQQKGWDFLLI